MSDLPARPRPLAERIVLRFVQRKASDVDLRELEITSQNLEEVLNGLITGVENLDAVEQRLKVDLRNMTQIMRELPHNDDIYHNGEDVLTHIGWVIDDAAKLSANMDAETRVLLKLTALFHDIGKTYTYRWHPEKQKHTFYDHATKSVEVAEVLLARHKKQLGHLYQQVIDLVRLHDVFFALAHERPKGQPGSTKYVRRLMQEAVYQQGLLHALLTFAKADSYRAKSYADKLQNMEGILEDVKRAEAEIVEEEAAKERQRQLVQQRLPKVRAYLEAEAPEAAALLPDLQATKQALGKAKRYDLLKGVEAIIRAPAV